ncbi:MAG: hypothetical protein Pg6C_05380 [Treponemataceae bacterium]|nr:MAG: hypothetical protein Pg6C_05380 [Treponemataceae bacterium]
MDNFPLMTERLFLRSPNINVCFRIIISGRIEQKRFSAAMDDVCKRHPLLNCSIKIDDNAWLVPNTSRIETEYYSYEEMPDWQVWHTETDNIPFDFLHGPLAKICVIDGGSQTEIIILGHHIIGDGVGYLNLAKDILLALDNKLEAIPQIPPANNKFRKGGKLGFLSKIYAKKLNKEWRKNRVRFSENDYHVFFREYRDKFVPGLYLDSIDGNDLEKLLENCKMNKLTVNELVTAAFAIAFAGALSPGKELRIGVAANTRNELTTKPHDCMGDYVTGISAKASVLETDFMSNAKNIASIIRKKLNDMNNRHLIVNFLNEFDGDLIESIMFASYGNYQLPISKQIGKLIAEGFDEKGLGMSNLGKAVFKNYEAFHLLDMQFIGPAFPANLLSVSIITVNNKLNIALRYNENEIKKDAVINVCKRAIGLSCDGSKGNATPC